MKELASLHDRHLNRPTLDDSSDQEHAIEITTQEITQVSGGSASPRLRRPGSEAITWYNSNLGASLPNLRFPRGLQEALTSSLCQHVYPMSWRSGDCFLVVGR